MNSKKKVEAIMSRYEVRHLNPFVYGVDSGMIWYVKSEIERTLDGNGTVRMCDTTVEGKPYKALTIVFWDGSKKHTTSKGGEVRWKR